MDSTIARSLLLSMVLVLLLVACADSPAPQSDNGLDTESETAVVPTASPAPTETTEPTVTPTPTATPEPTMLPEPTANALPSVETKQANPAPQFVLGELTAYQVESTGLTFDYPEGWVVTEDSDGGIRIESEEGYGNLFSTDDGVVIVILPMAAADLPGQDSLEKLASFILNNGMPQTAVLGDPSTLMINDQELTFSAFVDQTAGLEGVYAAFLAGDELAVIIAIAGGENRTTYRAGVEAIVNSIILPSAE